MFTVTYIIGDTEFTGCLLDLGASIIVMPLSVYKSLEIGPMRDKRVVIQLADRSTAYPLGVVKNVLIKVNRLIFPVGFYVVKTDKSHNSSTPSPIILEDPS